MIDRIKALCEIFSNTQQKRDKRFKEFQDFHSWCIENIPKGMLPNNFLIDEPIENIGKQYNTYKIELNSKDYYWWSVEYAKHPDILMKEVKYYQEKVLNELLDKILEYPQETKSELETVIKEIQSLNR